MSQVVQDEKNEENQYNYAIPKWDLSVNNKYIEYSNNFHTAKLREGKCITIRGPFWKSGRHIVHFKMHKVGHDGVGIISKAFDISEDHWIGNDNHSYGTWDTSSGCIAYHLGCLPVDRELKFKQGDIVTVDINFNDYTYLSWAINGVFLSDGDTVNNMPKQVAFAVTLSKQHDCVEIVGYSYAKQ
eukprot:514315_1